MKAEQLPMPEYLAIKAFSSGMAHTILTRSCLHAWLESAWNPNRVADNNNESDAGTIAHAAILEGNFDFVTVIDPQEHPAEKTGNIPNGWTNNSIRGARDNARASGFTPILKQDMPAIEAMVDTARSFIARSALAGVFDTGAPEVTVTWQDGSILCKARPDWLNDDICLHVKTTKGSVNPQSFERLAINMGYDISLAFYDRGIERKRHVILAIEQNAPWACKLFELSVAQQEISARKVERAINAWSACQKSGVYPSYSGDIHYIEPTSWQMAQAEQDMLTDEELKGGIPA